MSSGILGVKRLGYQCSQVVQASLNQKVTFKQELERDEVSYPVGILGGSFLPGVHLVWSPAVEQGYV